MNIFRITNCSVDYFPKNRVIATICRPPLPCGVRPGRSGGTGGAVSGWRSEERKASCGVLSGRSGRRTRDAGMRRRRPDRGPERLSEKAPNGLKNARIPENGDVYMKTFSDLCSRIRFVRASFGRRSAAAPSGMPGTATDDRDRFRTIRHETTAVFPSGVRPCRRIAVRRAGMRRSAVRRKAVSAVRPWPESGFGRHTVANSGYVSYFCGNILTNTESVSLFSLSESGKFKGERVSKHSRVLSHCGYRRGAVARFISGVFQNLLK